MALVLDDLKYFAVICETKNVTRASEIIGISQPALSYAMKRLENELGGELLIRMKTGIQLTKLGEEFRGRTRRLIYEWEQAQNLASPDSGLVQGSYTIAVHPSVALYTLDRFLPQLHKEFPALNFNFVHGLSREMLEKVVSWEADFGIVVNPIKHPDLVIKKLCDDLVTIFSIKGADNKLILDDNLAQSQAILKKLKKLVNYEGMINSGNLEVVARLSSLGVGHGLLPTRVASQYKGLKALPNAPTFKDEVALVYRPEKHRNPVSRRVIELIRSANY